MTIKIIETKKLVNGAVVRLQQRGQKFDVIRNDTGYTWRYVEKAVDEQRARNTFFMLSIQ